MRILYGRAYMEYRRRTGAEMDIDQFVEIFGARVVERWFDEPKTDAERKIKAIIDERLGRIKRDASTIGGNSLPGVESGTPRARQLSDFHC